MYTMATASRPKKMRPKSQRSRSDGYEVGHSRTCGGAAVGVELYTSVGLHVFLVIY